MRKIVANFFISLDGVMEAPEDWHFPYMNDEMGAAVGAGFASTDAMLMGRVNYEQGAAHWPSITDDPLAEIFNNIPKYVVSNTLETAAWNNSTIISGNVTEQLAELKQQEGKDIAMSGSATLAEWLLHAGLLDELRLLVHPIVVGNGRKLFGDDQPRLGLELADSKIYTNGVVDLTYRPAAQ